MFKTNPANINLSVQNEKHRILLVRVCVCVFLSLSHAIIRFMLFLELKSQSNGIHVMNSEYIEKMKRKKTAVQSNVSPALNTFKFAKDNRSLLKEIEIPFFHFAEIYNYLRNQFIRILTSPASRRMASAALYTSSFLAMSTL